MSKTSIAETIKNTRKKKGYSVMQIQVMLHDFWSIDVSIKTIYSWESGRSEPGLREFLALLDIYDMRNIGYFIGKDSFECDDDITKEDMYLLKQYHRNDPEYKRHRKAIQDIVQMPADLRSL